MVKISCRTSIDCAKCLQWPDSLPERPQIGDTIRSRSSTNNKCIELVVASCTWYWSEWHLSDTGRGEWKLEVQLQLPPGRNIPEFEKFVKS